MDSRPQGCQLKQKLRWPMRRESAHCRAGMRPAASASPKAARPSASGAMDEPDDPPSMLGDTSQSTSAKSAPDSAHCHGDLANVVRRLQRSRPSANTPTTRCSRMQTAGDPRGVLQSCEHRPVLFSFARSARFCSIVRYSLAPRCVAWASSSSTCCTAKADHPSLRPSARGWPRRSTARSALRGGWWVHWRTSTVQSA